MCDARANARAFVFWPCRHLACLGRDPGDHDGRGYDPNQPRVPAGHSDGGQWTNKATTNAAVHRKGGTFLGTDEVAVTRVTWNGEIVTEYFEPYYQMTPLEQEAVRVHEAVHVKQFQPYANRGWLGYLQAAAAYRLNWIEWEIAAYKAEYDFLNNYPIENLSQGMRDVLYYRRNAVRNNLEYFCRSTGGAKRAGC
jgi:hypothetical protein